MVNSKMRCIAKFWRLFDKLYELKWFSYEDSDCAKKQYDTLIQSANSELKDKSLMIESIHSSPSLCAVIRNSNAVGKYLS